MCAVVLMFSIDAVMVIYILYFKFCMDDIEGDILAANCSYWAHLGGI